MSRVRLLPFLWLLVLFAAFELRAAPGGSANARPEGLTLQRGAFTINWYMPAAGTAVRGVCVVGSGDGGWSYWEEIVCAHLAKRGWAVAGVDFAKYSTTDYTQAVLVADYGRLVTELARRAGPPSGDVPRPVVYGGWSMGAEQALPAAADVPARPAGLCGLLLVAPGARGRYGLHTKDKLGFTPTGEGTFGLADFAPQLHDLRLAQLHAGLDPLDSIKWYHGLKLDLRLWKYPRAFHDFDGAGDDFLKLMDEAITWLVSPPPRVEEKP